MLIVKEQKKATNKYTSKTHWWGHQVAEFPTTEWENPIYVFQRCYPIASKLVVATGQLI